MIEFDSEGSPRYPRCPDVDVWFRPSARYGVEDVWALAVIRDHLHGGAMTRKNPHRAFRESARILRDHHRAAERDERRDVPLDSEEAAEHMPLQPDLAADIAAAREALDAVRHIVGDCDFLWISAYCQGSQDARSGNERDRARRIRDRIRRGMVG